MSTKRKNQVGEGTQTPGSHSRKKAKIQEARQIAVQVPIHVVNGMRLTILDCNLMNLSKVSSSKPPVSLDVERFVDVSIYCSFDAHSLMFSRHGGSKSRRCRTRLRTPGDPAHTAIRIFLTLSRATSSKRSWQKLPRHLRRRAASHDTRRVPAYLREKAKEEVRPLFTVRASHRFSQMDPPGKSASAKSKSKKTGKNKVLPRTEELLRRQSLSPPYSGAPM